MQILIIQTAFLGDVVLATPVIEKLKLFYPTSSIDFLLRKGNEALLKDNPQLREVIIWDKKNGKWKNVLKLTKRFRATKYDLVINLQRYLTSGLLTVLSGGKQTIGFDKNPLSFLFSKRIPHRFSKEGEPILHEVTRNLLCIESVTDNTLALPRLYPSAQDFDKVQPYKTTSFITIAPASVWFTKQYPTEQWVTLINSLPSDLQIYLLGAPTDVDLCNAIITASNQANVTNLSGKITLLQSAALMQNATMNYVNDSAPLHIASAMDAPVTVVYCSTVPRFGYGPSGTKGRIVETTDPLKCRPCGLHGHKKCPEGHFLCAKTIQVNQLLEVLDY